MSLDLDACTDGELAALSLAGRRAAFAAIMRRHRDPVYRLIRGHIGEAEEALDVTQETFVAAFRNLARYDGARPMRAWLARIAINKSRDWQRRRRVRAFFGLTGGDDNRALAEAMPDDAPGADTAAADRQEMARLNTAIAALPATLKETLLLRTVEGLTQAEAAVALGVSEKAIETRLYRARGKLAEAMR
ncbi:RNA polymerase sigma factor [Sphingomonas solaris]|uniref:RNA polymerase sigma factor n=1 Tax=Alterirhizorhabdus solaris TaxID=2529389 RepID=A0A558R4F2_9SPHN|nr:RNA polymerase sigma factor [Sphingomonas solaris]TVV74256.1 RNA polymerase sigma factor [Sphingomonas solaris]